MTQEIKELKLANEKSEHEITQKFALVLKQKSEENEKTIKNLEKQIEDLQPKKLKIKE
jgi:hypothetical protein